MQGGMFFALKFNDFSGLGIFEKIACQLRQAEV